MVADLVMPTQWVDGLKVSVYPRKGRLPSFCFLDARATNGRISKSLLKGETLIVRVAFQQHKRATRPRWSSVPASCEHRSTVARAQGGFISVDQAHTRHHITLDKR